MINNNKGQFIVLLMSLTPCSTAAALTMCIIAVDVRGYNRNGIMMQGVGTHIKSVQGLVDLDLSFSGQIGYSVTSEGTKRLVNTETAICLVAAFLFYQQAEPP